MKIDGSIILDTQCIFEDDLPKVIVGNTWYITIKNKGDKVGKLWVPDINGNPVCIGTQDLTSLETRIQTAENQINVLNECTHVDMMGKSLIEYVKALPHGTHKCIQFQGATDTPSTNWYYAEIFVHIFNTNYFHINLYRLDAKDTPHYGGCFGGEFSGWEHTPSASEINNLQEQLNATQEMIINMTNLEG